MFLTSRENPRVARDALARGADAFLLKSAALGDVLSLLRGRAAHRPSTYWLPVQVQPLSIREEEVLDLVAQGLTNPAIASRMSLSTHTVRNRVAAIRTKVGAHSKLGAVSVARRAGLLG
ncbi:response regulator transcription factor [Nocardioides aurantiacus]|uniref:response regulator transcription factor n=1 Tax=Nocardioides aurantiacus TaxID=86796 RepID=UPI00403FBFAD